MQAIARMFERGINGSEPPGELPPSYAEATAPKDEENLPSYTSVDITEVGSDDDEIEEIEDIEEDTPMPLVTDGVMELESDQEQEDTPMPLVTSEVMELDSDQEQEETLKFRGIVEAMEVRSDEDEGLKGMGWWDHMFLDGYDE